MSPARVVTVDRGIVNVDGRRRFLTGLRLTARGRSALGTGADVHTLLGTLASTGSNAVVIDPADATDDLTRTAHDLDLVVLVDRGGRRNRSRLELLGSNGSLSAPTPWRLGWETGDERDLPYRMRRALRPPRVLTGFGAPSVAADDPWFDGPGRDWKRLGEPGAPTVDERDLACVVRHTPPAAFGDAQDWAAATRAYQAMVIRFHVETARRLRYAPLGLVAADALCDPGGGLSPALLGPDGTPKEAMTALTEALAPVTVIADRLPPHLHGNEALALDVHVANDLPEPLTAATVAATLTWAEGEQRYGFRGGAPADGVQRVGTIPIVVPAVSGPFVLQLELRWGDAVVTRTYRSDIFADPHDH